MRILFSYTISTAVTLPLRVSDIVAALLFSAQDWWGRTLHSETEMDI